MPKRKALQPDPILPTPLEEHFGEVWDPRGHEDELASANRLLVHFVEAMSRGIAPGNTLDEVRAAVEKLGHYSGYPYEAFNMECFLDSPIASSSYQRVAQMLPSFIQEMSARIQARVVRLAERPGPTVVVSPQVRGDKDVPF